MSNNGKVSEAVKSYVESGLDSQRRYAEDLFVKATNRVGDQINERLKNALATLRPEGRQVKLPDANKEALKIVEREFSRIAGKYNELTGLRLRDAHFAPDGSVNFINLEYMP